jgi:5-methyltetrahydropteroyltriglutamate--homocysteine methyltransferase
MAQSANLGFPRLGIKREWKKASEKYWAQQIDLEELLRSADELTARHWKLQADAGIGIIPVNDFAFYDLMLDTTVMVGAVPPRYGVKDDAEIDIDTYFAMARGRQDTKADVTAMEMTKWFDTNYHYIVPEFYETTKFRLASQHPFTAVERARKAGVKNPRPVLIGPVTYLLLGKLIDSGISRLDLIDGLVDVYIEALSCLTQMGVDWVQIDEPALILDLDDEGKELFNRAYKKLTALKNRSQILTATYFGEVGDNLDLALSLGVEGLHLDLVRAPEQLEEALNAIPDKMTLSLGVIDGRNVWRANLDKAFALLNKASDKIGLERIQVAPSCSLLHSPIDLKYESEMDAEIKEWLAFGVQKLEEVSTLTKALNFGKSAVPKEFRASAEAWEKRRNSSRVHNPKVQKRLNAVNNTMLKRKSPFEQRAQIQNREFKLPLLPTTTIGSFPQTLEVRKLRASFNKDDLTLVQYEKALETEMVKTIRFQEEIGLDVLVHGEFERNDMVEYFGEQMEGYVFTQNGWVQSYGSRGVKPPIIYGDIHRPHPMTVRWSAFAQKQTSKAMKGMLTGPVTMLQWSFVRDDQPRSLTCRQLALTIRAEVQDLEKAGVHIIQIDEPAIREGLPLRKKDWPRYLNWAVESFRLASSGVEDRTQIHTHMCYSEFNNIFQAIADLDADVISIEASRSRMDLFEAFKGFIYPNGIGPGVYDIHSPRVPSVEEMVELLRSALKFIPKERLWVNPDCGLKTRGWPEVTSALKNMVQSAKIVREGIGH